MKKSALLLIVLAAFSLLPAGLKAQDIVEISNGNHNQFNNALPTYTAANYSLSEQIYTAAEIGRAGTIYSITFKGSWYSATRNVDIYMVHTNKISFQNSKDWEPVTTADRVYSGIFAFPGYEVTIDLQVPFQYNGTDNLVLVVDDNTGSPASNTGNYFGPMLNIESFFSYSYPQVLQIYGNDMDYDPTSPINSLSLQGNLDYYKNQIWLGFASTCPPPTNPTDSIISQTSALLSWTESGSATQWQVCVNGDETNPITVTTTSYTLNGLTPGTDYPVKVRSICGANDTSQWCNDVIVNTVPSYPDLVEIGFCTGTSHGLLPSSSDDNYSLSEQIYTAAEIGRPGGNISGISFFNNGDTKTRTIDIYLAHTTKSSFLNWDDWVSVTASDWVFSDNVEMKAGEWTSIEFDVPFQYNGTDNLLLVVDDNTNSWSVGMDCFTFPTTESQALSLMGWVNFDPFSPNGYGGSLWNIKNCIQLNFGTVCPKPKHLTASTNHNEVTLTWTSSATNFNVEYKKTTDTQWQQTSTSTNTITLSGLDNANYEARVKAICDPGVSESVWDSVTFSIIDIHSTANWYSFVSSSPIHPDWSDRYVSFSMQNIIAADTASEPIIDYMPSNAYANGYVWCTLYNYNQGTINLGRAPLDNVNKTLGNLETVMVNFDTVDIFSMAYNPIDSNLYYVGSDNKLKSFNPDNPNSVTVIGTYTQDFHSISINSLGEAYCVAYNDSLYRMNLTNASVTLVGYLSNVSGLAFDLETDELFGTAYSGSGIKICYVNPSTADMLELEFIGGDPDIFLSHLFMVSSSAQVCYAPTNLNVSSIGMHSATVSWDANTSTDSWIVEYATLSDFSNAATVTVMTNSCYLTGLVDGTIYYVRVKADCGTSGESYWTVRNFITAFCESIDQCEISYELADSFGDGWTDCAINVVDVVSGSVIGTLTMDDGDSLSGVLPVCDGRDIRFEWVNGMYADETSYTIFTAFGDTLFSGSNAISAPISFTVNCPANPNIVKIGSCSAGSDYLPSHSSSNYSFSQQIYTASEINRTGTISGISFYNAGTTQSRNFDMYIVHTNKSAFDHNLDWISTTPADLVFSGPIEMAAGAWTEIALDVPFAYNGTDNILLVMNDKTGNNATGMSCYTFHTTAIEAIYGYRDGSSYDPMFPHSILGDYNHEKNCVRLNFGTNCTKPANLSVSENGMNSAKLVWDSTNNANAWIVEYSTADDFSGSTTTTVNTNSYILTGLTPETEYHVRVKADCGADGESYWNVISFFTNSCPIENQCEITYKLGDSYGDGWTGNAINVVDVTSNIVLDTWTIQYGDSASGSLFVCDGREIKFEWVSGYDPNDISYRVYDANGVQILNGVGAFLTPVTYMVNCTSSPCPTPDNIAVSNFSGGTVTVSWTENGSATSWQICLDGNEANPISVNTNPYTLSGLDSTVFHNVKVRANCGSDYSFWSTPASFAQVQSTGNWYAYVQSCPNNTDLRNKFVSFSAQDPANASAASNVIPNVLAATYANGEVWFFDEDNTNLYKAPLDNYNKTMGTYVTVASNFDGNNNIASMSYNPVDGRIYYILYTPSQTVKLKSFDPSNINDVTEIGTFNNYAFSIAIDNNGNAYCTDLMTGNLCQVNLTNATTTPVGDLGFSSTMPVIAFDMNTGELLMGQLESSGDNGIYLVNPATAEKQFVGYIGGGTGATISGLFMVSAAPVVTCPAPTNLTASNITHNGVDLSWTENGSATGWQVCINGNETSPIDVYTNPYTLSGLSSTTTYTVKVRANCGADGTSDWSNEVSFTTDIEPFPPYFYITGDDSICPNQTTVLNVNTNMGSDYLWSTGETGQSITVPVGTYYVTVSNNGNEVAHGNFTVGAKETYNFTLNDTICEAELPYPWNGITFNAAGDTTITFTAANGCDSVVSLHLTVYSTDYTDLHESICEGESFVFNGKTISQNGVYVDTLANAHHCDSIVTLHLTVNPISSGDTTAIACDSFDWYEHTGITASCDNLTHTFTNASGCDSVVTLHLTINHSNTGDTTATAQDSFTWYEHTNITQTGNYTHTFVNAAGCDSVVTLHLTIGHASLGDTTAVACDSFDWYEHTGITQSGDYTHTFVNAVGYDSIVTLHLTVNYSNTGDTTATACDSFDWYEHTGITSSCDNLTHTFTNANGCDSVVTLHLTIYHSNTGDTIVTACDSFDWYEHTGITASCDNLTHTFTNANGCDSVVTLHLTINHSNTGDTTATAQDSFTWYEHTNITQTGNYTHTFVNAAGCDSVVTLHLTIGHSSLGDTTATACDSFDWYEHTGITQSGDFTHTFTNAAGYDSLVTLHLTVNYSSTGDTTATACDSFDWYEHTNITASCDNLTHTFTNASGCDSVVTLHLTINHSNTGDTTATAQDSFSWYEHTNITQTGNYTHTFVNAAGCDSVVTLHLTIGHSSLGDTTATACDSFDWYEHTGITQSGDFTHTFTNAAGYDSLVTLHLTVNYSSTGDTTATACDSFDWYEHTNITASCDNLTHTFTNANGCDSVVTLHLTVYSTQYTDLHVSICQSELPYHYINGQIDTTFGVGTPSLVTAPHTLSTVNGCDSIVTLHLTVSPVYHVNETRSICPNELPYTWNNFTFGTGGTQTVTLTSSAGCDSIVTMTLILNPVYNVSETRSICRSDLPYTWNNFTFGTGGTQTVTLTSSAGCDSVVTMTLIVNEPVSTNLQVAACDSYEWNGETYTESGDHTLTFTTVNGCDSVVTLHLTINHAVSSEFTVETSDSCYIWNDQEYCISGYYEQTLTAANGCDSVVTLHLTINVGIDNYDFAASMTVYPNPTTGILNVRISNFDTPISEFLTYDVYGKLVDKVRTQFDNSTETTQIDMSQLSNGIYFVKAVADGKVVAMRKVVKQ